MDLAEIALVRSSFEATLREAPERALLAALTEAGWTELVEAEPVVAVAELFEAAGRLLVATPAVDVVMAGALGIALAPGTAVVHPALAAWATPPGREQTPGEFTVDGLVLAGTAGVERLLVPSMTAAGATVVVPVAAARLDLTPVNGFDDALRLVRAHGTIAVDPGAAGTGAGPGSPGSRFDDAARAARRALGHELLGVAQEALDVAARHVTDRIQFGRPIAAFQTVRHRLTEVYVAVASARAALGAAWTSEEPVAADAAKALAGRAALLAGKHCLQVTGAIGFTWEYELHRRIRRAILLDGLYGTSRSLSARIGASLLSERRVPRLHPPT